MANNLTTGAVQVLNNDVISLNHAFQQIVNLIDDLKGLRGRTDLFDQATVSVPQQGNAAVRLDTISDLTADVRDPFLSIRLQNGQPGYPLDESIIDAIMGLVTYWPTARHPAPPSAANLRFLRTFGAGVETMDIYQVFLALQERGEAQ
jgi:hypothetical protein